MPAYLSAVDAAADFIGTDVRTHGMEDRVMVNGGMELHRGVQKLNPRIKVMPEASSIDRVTRVVDELRPKVIA